MKDKLFEALNILKLRWEYIGYDTTFVYLTRSRAVIHFEEDFMYGCPGFTIYYGNVKNQMTLNDELDVDAVAFHLRYMLRDLLIAEAGLR